jgi:hypothetical protein
MDKRLHYTADKGNWDAVIRKHLQQNLNTPFFIIESPKSYSEWLEIREKAEFDITGEIIEHQIIYTFKDGSEYLIETSDKNRNPIFFQLFWYDDSMELVYEFFYDANGKFTDVYNYKTDKAALSLEELEIENKANFYFLDKQYVLQKTRIFNVNL